jgi:hypothetical protein
VRCCQWYASIKAEATKLSREYADMAARKSASTTLAKQTATAKQRDVDEFLAGKQHPLERDIQTIRTVILDVDASIREEIKWNSVSFCNDHDFFATVNLRSTDSVQLVLHTGVKRKATAETGVHVDDPRGLIEKWPAKDRCIVNLGNGAGLNAKTPALAALVKDWIRFVDSSS